MQQKRYSSDLTERQWAKLVPLFVVQRTSKWPLQAIVNGIFYMLKNGCVWRDVPAYFPPGPRCTTISRSGPQMAPGSASVAV
ncbi:transposase [Hymenobacter defluvii]|uniref:Transposase n=1 Tax=Hymenobacter defluvii TaxID=2054411 RepID=A0ABS3TIY3_9BACT|nr:transposase [Hymenobacter defluvii]